MTDTTDTEPIDPAIPLDGDETVEWTGRPRWTVVLPAVVTGLVLAVAGVIGWRYYGLLALLLVPVGLAIPLWRYRRNQGTQYVVTDQALYVKRGVLSRYVSQANLDTVQNSSYAQSITGSLFGYGSVDFEIAGGDDLTFRAIEGPQEVRALVDRATGASDSVSGESSRSPGARGIPGRLDQWQRVRDEVRAARQALE